jgi:hypothetical protein
MSPPNVVCFLAEVPVFSIPLDRSRKTALTSFLILGIGLTLSEGGGSSEDNSSGAAAAGAGCLGLAAVGAKGLGPAFKGCGVAGKAATATKIGGAAATAGAVGELGAASRVAGSAAEMGAAGRAAGSAGDDVLRTGLAAEGAAAEGTGGASGIVDDIRPGPPAGGDIPPPSSDLAVEVRASGLPDEGAEASSRAAKTTDEAKDLARDGAQEALEQGTELMGEDEEE